MARSLLPTRWAVFWSKCQASRRWAKPIALFFVESTFNRSITRASSRLWVMTSNESMLLTIYSACLSMLGDLRGNRGPGRGVLKPLFFP